MTPATQSPPKPEVFYPDSDGQPVAENTLQFEWIMIIKFGMDAVFRNRPDVFIAGDLFWYPVEGDNKTRTAPDILVVFGRPKGHRGSYRQWEEGDIAPQVVFEVLSPGNRMGEMVRKFRYYERYGVEEYYVYDPDLRELSGWVREGSELGEIPVMNGWVSPRMRVRFEIQPGRELRVFGPDGQPFATYLEILERAEEAEQARRKADQERLKAEQEKREAEEGKRKAEEEKRKALEEQEKQQRRAERMAAKLREMGLKPEEFS